MPASVSIAVGEGTASVEIASGSGRRFDFEDNRRDIVLLGLCDVGRVRSAAEFLDDLGRWFVAVEAHDLQRVLVAVWVVIRDQRIEDAIGQQ